MIAREPGFSPGSKLYRPAAQFFRGSLGRFATGVAVVTFDATTENGSVKRHGLTVNSFTAVSMDPPLVLVSIQRTVKSHDFLQDCAFSVNILGAEQQALAMNFAGQPTPEGAPVWQEGEHAPRLAGVLSWFECTPWAAYDGGDHTLFVGRVAAYDYRTGDALGFVNGQFTTIHESAQGHESLF
ncbi:NADH-FMN oxidoreductase RutF, flavin reductase (DIM6/NTAB) family [Amycolatopsis xylanica]|uniref:NADH-FMN oxidoreductase RutF, flavin reductase (DIM6/NTAB) family n=1 Tax=Amycolatopsis xylanica TaxID=589385 RepID=A0A1H3KAI5_9PSEU|nr:flavin reductase family protein [Amycolatopsis xylanica]SDY49123.1 NADH-FMN oxidoreductase RutF, flavin reductase (DIM6/NTAB) family [Amycolatopsis xylanica]